VGEEGEDEKEEEEHFGWLRSFFFWVGGRGEEEEEEVWCLHFNFFLPLLWVGRFFGLGLGWALGTGVFALLLMALGSVQIFI